MSGPPDGLYFRIRDNGAQVFRVDTTNSNRRIEMDPLAVVNTRNGDIRVQGDRVMTPDEEAEIKGWCAARQAELARREGPGGVAETVERLNLTASWLQQRATEEEVEAAADDLLMAMHDLRAVIVRKKADRLNRS